MADNQYQPIIDQWANGNPAPYSLYYGYNILSGQRLLVEAIGDNSEPIIKKGDVIGPDLAAQVVAQHTAVPIGPPVPVSILVRDENGNPTFDHEGNAVTATIEVTPLSEVHPLTYAPPTLAYEDDHHCDMCGVWSKDNMNKIGDGWYCKTVRTTSDGLTATCFDIRIKQMVENGHVK